MMPTPFTPENIHQGDDGRWYHDGVDVTDWLVTWTCNLGHTWEASMETRTSENDAGCPTCWAANSLEQGEAR